MAEIFTGLVEWMSALSPVATYLTILSVAYLENVLPPVPGDMIVVFGGYMAGLGVLNPWVVIGLATIGGTLGIHVYVRYRASSWARVVGSRSLQMAPETSYP